MSDANTPPIKHTGGKFRKGVSGNPGGKRKQPVAPQSSPQTPQPSPQPAPQEAAAQASQPRVEQPDNAPKRQGGKWQKGQSGNPSGMAKGTRHHATRLAEALLDGQAQEIVQKVISLALAGDPAALKLALERICPPRRDRPVSLTLPTIASASDLISATAALTAAAADGTVTPSEASDLGRLVEVTAKAIEVHEFAERLARLEAQMASKANQ